MRRQLPEYWVRVPDGTLAALLRARDRFDSDCVPGTQFESSRVHHAVRIQQRFPGSLRNGPELAGFARAFRSLQRPIPITGAVSVPLSLPAKSRFPATETRLAETWFECGSLGGRRSISCCQDHSAGKSVEASHAHAVRESAIDGRFDEIRCEEGK